MTFLGDEGRDVIIVRRLLVEGHPPLIGPGTSVGSMYLGPLYYYMMAPALLLANFSPVGPAVMIAILGVITVAFVWWVGRIWFNKTTGLIAAGLYAIAPIVIYYSRSSWNPDIMPFFALFSVYSVWKVWRQHQFNWLIVMGISFAFVLQSHYLGLLLAPTLFLFWILSFLKVKKTDYQKSFINKSMIGIFSFLILMSPLLFFDIRHNWMNSRALYAFLTAKDPSVTFNFWTSILKIPVIFNQIAISLLGAKNIFLGEIISVVMAVSITILIYINIVGKKKILSNINSAYYLIVSWFGFGLIGLGLYRKDIYDHYFGFLFVVPFIITGIVISKLMSGKIMFKVLGIGLLVCFIIISLVNNPFLKSPNRLLQRSIDVSKIIEQNSGNTSFNLAVIADTNYEDGYKYFLLKDNYPVIDIDAQIPGTITGQLFAVCELIPNSKCDPTHNAKAQVASFGWSKIKDSWEVDGAIVYKLVHTKQ
jgi:4-amino-4-deoxy-L-arabinose transferase-like glycosyltransferase